MTDRWVTDPDGSNGRLVPLTAAEQAQFDADQAGAQQQITAEAVLDGNAATMTTRAGQALTTLEDNVAWGALTPAQKLELLRLVVARLTRLMLRRLDAAP